MATKARHFKLFWRRARRQGIDSRQTSSMGGGMFTHGSGELGRASSGNQGTNSRVKRSFVRPLGAACLLLVGMIFPARPAHAYTGTVVDAATEAPIGNAIVTLGDLTVRTGANGRFAIDGPGDEIGFRAYGYQRRSVPAASFRAGSAEVRLTAFQPKALYLSYYGVGSRKLRQDALAAIRQHGLNAVVIDVKGDRGLISFKTPVALAEQIGAQKTVTMADPQALIADLHRQDLYTIARIVVFKDDRLATARPDLAVKRIGGGLYKDREDSGWTDPFEKEVWNYNIAIAVEAARLGFDEIQFDYVRFPDATGVVFAEPSTMESRLEAISGFLVQARKELTPYNVFLAADVFGYVMWNRDDTGIGERLEELSRVVDYISPMLYPSCFQFGIPGYRVPVTHPYEVVFQSLQEGQTRTGIAPIRFRPWLQVFRDYAFDHRAYGNAEIDAQIKAAKTFGSDGWMLWNPHNIYFSSDPNGGTASCGSDAAK
jgi:hypothetical protein